MADISGPVSSGFRGKADGVVSLQWLGQAGFLLEAPGSKGCKGLRVVIDPYLSDSLYDKYKDSKFPHRRMVPPPVMPDKLTDIDFVLCTHGHTDHLDSGSLPGLAQANPDCRFICPASEQAKAVSRGVPFDRFIGLDDGGIFNAQELCFSVTAIASAHEQLSFDDEGRSLYLGYVIEIGGIKLYHSGDCVPYDGLKFRLSEQNADAALLPVNGRDEYRKSNGVPGNFTVKEAAQLCLEAGIDVIFPHHFGMFDFNTESPETIERVLSESGLKYIMPEIGNIYNVSN